MIVKMCYNFDITYLKLCRSKKMKNIRIYKAAIRGIILLVIGLLVFGTYPIYLNKFSESDSAKATSYSQAKRNVSLFCSKAYFNKVYSDTKTEILKSPFPFDFYVSQNPTDFFVAGFENDKLVFYYTNSKQFLGYENIKIGSSLQDVKRTKLKFLKSFVILKGMKKYNFTDVNLGKEYDVALVNNSYYVYFFYDKLVSPNIINGIFMVKKGIWDDFLINDDVFKKQKDINHLLSAFERLCYLHLNSIRSQEGKQLFRYSDKISIVARLHSQNMAKYNFFGHTDVFGQSPTDRFQKHAIAFKKIGENLAMGTKLLPFFANHLLLNSKGHRENIESNFEYTAVGCAVDFNTDNVYYTQNFANLIYSQDSTFGR